MAGYSIPKKCVPDSNKNKNKSDKAEQNKNLDKTWSCCQIVEALKTRNKVIKNETSTKT